MTELLAPVSPGELLDKITILRIKQQRFTDPVKRQFVEVELQRLQASWRQSQLGNAAIDTLVTQLQIVNEQLWDIEDELRSLESQHDFGERFIHQARQVYITNDRRAALKLQINQLLGSELIEQKEHPQYSSSQ